MLLNFKFKNFKSYKETCEFSMLTNKDKSHDYRLVIFGKERLSTTKIIYGPNASGKSNFFSALQFVKSFALKSNNLVETDVIGVSPYKFRKNYEKVPSEFSITFIKDNVKYYYSFSCTNEKVIDEKLDVYYSAKATNIFTRTNTDEYKFNADLRQLNEIKTKNTKNKLFLVTAATWNYVKVKPVVEFILNDILVLGDEIQSPQYKINIGYVRLRNDLDEFKTFCLEFLNNADITINDFEMSFQKVKEMGEKNELLAKVMMAVFDNDPKKIALFNNLESYDVTTFHNVKEGDNVDSYPLNLMEESIGTQQLFHIAPALFYAFKEGKTLLIDEINRSLHPLLVEYIIKKFHDDELNPHNAQLICNTHDTNLLNLDLFRRDEIWFTEQNIDTLSTEMFALSEFSPRKDENIERAYLIGRFGGIPLIRDY